MMTGLAQNIRYALDPPTLGTVPLAVLLLVALAALVPARRAARTGPMTVLRSE
jgi:ABC-type lipoprotein release transport system permease subunit